MVVRRVLHHDSQVTDGEAPEAQQMPLAPDHADDRNVHIDARH